MFQVATCGTCFQARQCQKYAQMLFIFVIFTLNLVHRTDCSSNLSEDAALPSRTVVRSASIEASAPVNEEEINNSRLRITRLVGPDAVQNGTQNVTIDCMFKFDKKLDQRLTIKWFFNDELEPIYQWIPELEKRTFSDKYEHMIDKNYDVTQDIEHMLKIYRHLQHDSSSSVAGIESSLDGGGGGGGLHENELNQNGGGGSNSNALGDRLLLAKKLERLARLGGHQSRQLVDLLRSSLEMDEPEYTKFRALRLIKPKLEMNGKFTCSVSSLEGDDLKSSELVVYEPAKSFTFDVSRISSQLLNLTCRASGLYPRPKLTLLRYRAGPFDVRQRHQLSSASQIAMPRLQAATLLRQEPIPNQKQQLYVAGQPLVDEQQPQVRKALRLIASSPTNEIYTETETDFQLFVASSSSSSSSPDRATNLPYDAQSWALVDEASLSTNVVTQFECVVAIERANYEQRQMLALQKGWHVNPAGWRSQATFVGVFGALASLLCLMLALVSCLLVVKLLRKHAKNRVHQVASSDTQTKCT